MSEDFESKLVRMLRRQEICMVAFGAVLLLFAIILIVDRGSQDGLKLENSNSNVQGEGLGASRFRDYYTQQEFSELSGLSLSTIRRKREAGLVVPSPWKTTAGDWAFAKDARVIDERSMDSQ
jgi:hypothetical protein